MSLEPKFGSGGKIRVTTGCVTCRIRRVKCDEGRPHCKKCTSTGRKCDGYTGAPLPRSRSKNPSPDPGMASTSRNSPSPHPTIKLPAFDNTEQLQSFEFFINCTCSISPTYFGANFWSFRVLQLSLSEPAIKYALCSLSLLHRGIKNINSLHGEVDTAAAERFRAESRKLSLHEYNNAVAHTQRLLQESSNGSEDAIIKGLVACILFVCYENLHQNFTVAQMHLQNGLKILTRYASSTNVIENTQPQIPLDIIHTIERLDLQAMSIGDATSPYPYHSWPGSLEFPTFETPSSSLSDALASLITLTRWFFALANYAVPNLLAQSDLDKAAMILFERRVDLQRIIDSLNLPEATKQEKTMLLIKMYHNMLEILIGTRCFGFEMLHDDFTLQYEHLVELGLQILALEKGTVDQPFFSLEMGIIFPLFYTAIKCRDPWIRRKAIDLLVNMNHQEGSWESSGAAKYATFVMNVEEDGLKPCWSIMRRGGLM
ncbi:uncharacterized protein LY89DRAFT_718624 [Mollisia scopiformis]|uniref:Zn(2)-C6 fungal-type domain-containing protein n=1 Tax=Mollisia scopiformis TaxID=149040 RepID=A0A194X9Q8_MOLSC|nr:uncharacterized protein LY89DRAFT_718624 [Mollisia scopiformis]KUJ16901.1 hypothetical protein LY89DRAFT_718624 [Mollisia scopiformis]